MKYVMTLAAFAAVLAGAAHAQGTAGTADNIDMSWEKNGRTNHVTKDTDENGTSTYTRSTTGTTANGSTYSIEGERGIASDGDAAAQRNVTVNGANGKTYTNTTNVGYNAATGNEVHVRKAQTSGAAGTVTRGSVRVDGQAGAARAVRTTTTNASTDEATTRVRGGARRNAQ